VKPAVLTCSCSQKKLFFEKKREKNCRFAVLVELAVLVASDWQNENITFLVFNILKLAKKIQVERTRGFKSNLCSKKLNKIQVQSVITCSRSCFEHVQKKSYIFGYFNMFKKLTEIERNLEKWI
jgi:hypothetical protein